MHGKIILVPGPNSHNARAKELTISEIRSHAARVSHRRRKKSFPKAADEEVQCDGMNTRCAYDQSRPQARSGSSNSSRKIETNPVVRLVKQPLVMSLEFNTAVTIYQKTLAVNTLAIFDVLQIETSFTDQWLVYATHEDVLPAMTAAMAFVQNAKPCPMALKLAGRAFRKVNQAISNNHAERTPLILAIIWLSVIADLRREMDTLRQHRQALNDIVQDLGGLRCVPPFVRAVLEQAEIFWMLETGHRGLVEIPSFHKAPRLPSRSDADLIATHLPIGFQLLARQNKLSVATLRAIYKIHRRRCPQDADYDTSFARYLPELSSASTVLSSLLYEDATSPSINKLLYMALILYASIWYTDVSVDEAIRTSWSTPMVWSRSELTRALLSDCHNWASEENECLYWIWHVVLVTWEVTSAPMDALQLRKQSRHRFKGGVFELLRGDEILNRYFPLRPRPTI